MIVIKDRAHMSIGRSFSLEVDYSHHYDYECWQHGNSYNYGMLPPRYPVPSCIGQVDFAVNPSQWIICTPDDKDWLAVWFEG